MKLTIPGNKICEYFATHPNINHEDMHFTPVEKEVFKEQGLNHEDYIITEYTPGLKMRGSNDGIKNPAILIDGYELVVEKK